MTSEPQGKGWNTLLVNGAAMGITAMIPDMTIGQLTTEATERWGEIWDPMATRMTILLLCPRKERKMMELHGDMVEHGQPVMAAFHRPRAEAHLLSEQGFEPRAASFQFVNIATADMGPMDATVGQQRRVVAQHRRTCPHAVLGWTSHPTTV